MLIVLLPPQRTNKPTNQSTTSLKMGFGDDIKEFENDATGQGGNDGDNNANNANGSNDKTEDTMVDSGNKCPSFLPLFPPTLKRNLDLSATLGIFC